MYGGSSKLISQRDVKTLRREVFSVKLGAPKAAPHQRWRSTTIFFGPSNCPENMAGAEVLPLLTAPTIANIKLHHVLIDGGAALNVISYAAFKQLQTPESRLDPSCLFSGVGPHPVYLVGTIYLPVTFGMEENFRTENVQFDIAEVNRPFNAIICRPALYRFMAVAHYGYLVLKMLSPAGVLTVNGDRTAALAAIEKLHALAAGLIPAASAEGSAPHPHALGHQPRCPRSVHLIRTMSPSRPSRLERSPPRPPGLGGTWERNRKACSSSSSGQMLTCSPGNHLRCPGFLGR
jgi:hypothetical protein